MIDPHFTFYMGTLDTYIHSFLTSALYTGAQSTSCFVPKKETLVPIDQKAG
jgi:hypothetical protein